MRYLVTGGAGFIGSSIAHALLARGDAVTVLDDLSSGYEENLQGATGNVDLVRGDICDRATVERCVRDAAGVFHQAAMASVPQSIQSPARCEEVNVIGTVNVLDACRSAGVARVVLAASAAAYGDDPTLPKHEQLIPRPGSPYAASKVAAEHYMGLYASLHGMRTLSLRYFNVFGPRQDPNSQYAAVVPKFVQSLCAGEAPVIFGDGEQTRDFCFIDNVVQANFAAMQSEGACGQVVNIASGSATSLLELARMLNDVLGTDLTPTHGDVRAGDIRHSWADIGAARSLLDFVPEISVQDGLARTIAAHQDGA